MKYIIPLAAIVLLAAACNSKATEKKNLPLQQEIIPVKLAPVSGDSGHHGLTVSGLLSTENEARLSFKIGGIIENIVVKEGQFVKQGQLLATLKSTEIAAQLQQVTLSVEKAQRDYQRAANLYKDSVATLEQLQNAKTGVDIAKQNLQQVAFNKQYANIYAPNDGFIVKKMGNVGELAAAGAPILFMSAVSTNSKWILKAGISDREWATIKQGDNATVTIDAFPGKTFNGIVSKKALAADAASGSFQIEVQVNPIGVQPAIGMFAKASIAGTVASNGFSIPYEALLEANGKTGFVFVTNDQKTVTRVTVAISSITNNTVYVAEGLQGYNYVVIAGSPYLSDNATIQVTK
jgi:membrane fusion protein, multidrug efflux system